MRLTTDLHLASRLIVSAAVPFLYNNRKDKLGFDFAYCFNVGEFSLRSAHTVTAGVV